MGRFSQELRMEVHVAQDYLLKTYRLSLRMLFDEMRRPVSAGGRMPVLTEYLRYSLNTRLHSPIELKPVPEGGRPDYSSWGRSVAIINKARPGAVVHFGFTAPYAARMNYGFTGTDSLGRQYNQPGRHFVEGAVAQWDKFVAEASRMAKTGAKLGEEA